MYHQNTPTPTPSALTPAAQGGIRRRAPDAGPQTAITSHQQLLAAHRATLATYRIQLALAGEAHARPEVINGIGAARAGIAQAKAALATLGEPAADLPGDVA